MKKTVQGKNWVHQKDRKHKTEPTRAEASIIEE